MMASSPEDMTSHEVMSTRHCMSSHDDMSSCDGMSLHDDMSSSDDMSSHDVMSSHGFWRPGGAPTYRVATYRVSILSCMQARHAIEKGSPAVKSRKS